MLESVTPKRDKSKKGVNKKQAKRVWAFNALLGRLKELNLKTDGNDNPRDVYATPCAQLSRHRRWSVLVVERRKSLRGQNPLLLRRWCETVDDSMALSAPLIFDSNHKCILPAFMVRAVER